MALATHVVWQLALTNPFVLLLDADSRASASDWVGLREKTPFTVMACRRPNLHRDVDELRQPFNQIVIDGHRAVTPY